MDILLKISYIIFALSFSILILIFSFYEPEKISLEQTEHLEEDQSFKVEAKVIKVTESPGMVFLEVEQKVNKQVSVFKDNKTNFTEIKNKNIIVEGHINEYNNKKSLLADKIKTIN